jgi:membrane-associated phospholipid phosphatase
LWAARPPPPPPPAPPAPGLGVMLQAVDVLRAGPISRIDRPIHQWIVHHRPGALNAIMETVTWLGSSAVLVPLLAAAGAWLLYSRRDLRAAGYLWGGYAGVVILANLGKALIARPRPSRTDMLMAAGGYSFPSGHTAQATTAWILLAVMATAAAGPSRARIAGCCTAVALVAISRVYLGVHWPTDVLGGLLLGIAWTALLTTIWHPHLAPVRGVVVYEGEDEPDPC